jgi:hypothetical protein
MNGKLNDLQSVLDCAIVHLDLEAVAVTADAGDVDDAQRGGTPELEAGRDIP